MVTEVKGWTREQMAQRLAVDIPDGSYVNLGIGMPELVARFIPEGREAIYHVENGLLGMGPDPAPGTEDPELINAGKKPVTAIQGAAYFHHADSFVMTLSPKRSMSFSSTSLPARMESRRGFDLFFSGGRSSHRGGARNRSNGSGAFAPSSPGSAS